MKKTLAVLLCLLMAFCVFAQGSSEPAATTPAATAKPAAQKYHIGVVTGTVSQSEDDLRGAEALIKEYGAVKDGGIIQHVTYPDNFMDEAETTISVIAGLADDPLMKAVIVNQAVPGTTEAFRRIKEKRPDILTIAGEAHEDPAVIESASDLVVQNDFVARGYLMIHTAHELGCDTFVHISFPRHLSYETMSRRAAIMKATCADLGMKFVMETAPDPTSDVGIPGAQQYMLEKVPAWVEKYGQKAAFFCTNDAETEPLLKQLLAYGGYFIEADLPSPLMGYPGALGIDLSAEAGNFPAILKKVESAIVEKGGAGRFGTWAYSYGYTTTAGLGQHAMNVLDGKSELAKLSDIMKAYNKYTPGAQWNGSFYTNVDTGVRAKNHVLIYQDTYMMGKGYMHGTDVTVPEKYFPLK
ncbi:MAG: DUF3798 domain-containing protein [Sphaerochaetaceae bacterium]